MNIPNGGGDFWQWATTPEGEAFLSSSPQDVPLAASGRPGGSVELLGGEHVLTDPYSFAPVQSSGASTVEAIFRGIGGVIDALGAPASTQLGFAQIGLPRPGQLGGIVGPQVEVETGMPLSARGLACTVKRRRYKIVRTPDGGIRADAYCLPRRMNPLNPRALARAGRRVASFSRIAKGMQKMLERSCGGAARKRRSSSFSCSTKRCR